MGGINFKNSFPNGAAQMFRTISVPVFDKAKSQSPVKIGQPVDVPGANDEKAQHTSIHPFDVGREIETSASSKRARTSNVPPMALMVDSKVLNLTSPRFSNLEMAGCFTPAFFASVIWECPYNSRRSFNLTPAVLR